MGTSTKDGPALVALGLFFSASCAIISWRYYGEFLSVSAAFGSGLMLGLALMIAAVYRLRQYFNRLAGRDLWSEE